MDERSLRIESQFEWPMVVTALLVIPLLVIEESDFGQPWDAVGVVLNWGTWLAFLTEFVVMMAVTPKRTAWLRRHPIDVAVIFLTPPFLPGLAVFRLLRLLRLSRLFTLRGLLSLQGIRYAAFVTLLVVVLGGAAFSAVETDQGLSAWDGVWWAATTVTTVGYGDIKPETDVGRVFAIAVMFTGIGFVALLTAFVADRFIRKDAGEEEEARENRVFEELKIIGERLDRLERRLE